jgi:hypothetical protein
MSGRVKIKKILKKSGASDPFNSSFMNQMNDKIVERKLKKLDVSVSSFCKLEIQLLEFFYTNFNEYSANAKDLIEKIEDYEAHYRSLIDKVPVVERYKMFKKSHLFNHIIKTCEILIVHKDDLSDKTKLNTDFIFNTPGNELGLIYGWDVNFKHLLMDDDKFEDSGIYTKTKTYTLLSLYLMLKGSMHIYEIIMQPDVDIDNFVHTVLSAVDDLEKRIPRCREAFKKLRESVSMLKKNFGGYYGEFVKTGNQSSILTDFVQDLISANKTNIQLVRQFREIMKYLKKAYESAPKKNKEIDDLLKNLNSFSEVIEKNIDKQDSEDENSNADDQPISEKPNADESIDKSSEEN